jgi:hypothetical protein
MLAEHDRELEYRGKDRQRRMALAKSFGEFVAGLAPWDWFINPISFRDRQKNIDGPDAKIRPSREGIQCAPDPRIVSWSPPQRGFAESGPPVPDAALARIKEYMRALQGASDAPVGWIIAEEFGRVGGRYHCHALVSGVARLRRDEWWNEAFKRFGRTQISPFNPVRGAAFYTAKYAAKQLGGLHFGGVLAGVDLTRLEATPPKAGGRVVVVHSAELPRDFFRMLNPRRHK